MKTKALGYGIVVLWRHLLTDMPKLDQNFIEELFGDPSKTSSGLTPEGFSIALEPEPFALTPSVVLAPDKLQVSHYSIDETLLTLIAVMEHVKENQGSEALPASKSIGMNSDLELAELPDQGLIWLAHRFLPDIDPASGKIVQKSLTDIRFRVNYEDRGQRYDIGFLIQPRGNIPNGLYVSTNDNRVDLNVHSQKDELLSLFKDSDEVVQSKLLPFILKED